MAGLIKKQILKHLSKFAKNLSADSIHLSTLRGEGELNNLELDCVAIQNLVNLPTWLQINHAKCKRVHVKIPWTKLKTSPITLFLDCVEVDMVTCEKPRAPNGPSPIEASASGGDSSYGFIEKVLEGMAVRIDSINVKFSSAVFKAEFQLSQLLVYSTDPDGKKTDLRFTRIMNKAWGQVLTFKKISWQTMRIVTDAATVQTGGTTTPIRLITNQAVLRLIMRRKISDLSVLASQLTLQFDDLLWVLTDAQVQSAMLCVKSIRETIERSQQQGRVQSGDKAQNNQTISPPATPNVNDPNQATPTTPCDPYFMRHIIHESSFHCDIDRIDLHICDDGSTTNLEATHKKVVEGGAIIITLHELKMDHYPSHKAGKSRSYFRDYNDIAAARDKWAEEIIVKFRKDFVELKKAATQVPGYEVPKTNAKLLESCMLFRLGDIDIGQVSSSNDKERCDHKVVSSGRKELLLPDDMPLATVIITDYYFPDGRDYPSPHSNIFLRAIAPYIRTHWPSLLWINQLAMSTMKSVQRMLEDLGIVIGGGDVKEEDHTDIRVEALMPKVFIPSPKESSDPDVPEGIELQVSQATVTNCRCGENSSQKSLAEVLSKLKKTFMNENNTEFPCDVGHEYDLLYEAFANHAAKKDVPLTCALKGDKPELKASSLKSKAYQDVWSVWIRQVWLDFIMKEPTNMSSTVKTRKTMPFIDSVPISIWITKSKVFFEPLSPIVIPVKPRRTESLPASPNQSTPVPDKVSKSTSDTAIVTSSRDTNLNDLSVNSDIKKQTFTKDEAKENERQRRNQALLDFYRHTLEEKEPEPTPSKEVKQIGGPAGTYLLVNSQKPVRLMLDHHQFLFLLRLAENVHAIGEKVFNDTSTILSDPSSGVNTLNAMSDDDNHTDSTAVRIALPSVDLFLVLRPTSDTESNVTNSDDQATPPPMSTTRSEPVRLSSSSPFSPSSDALIPPTPSSSECSSVDTISILGEDVSSLSIFSSSTYSVEDAPLLGDTRERLSLPGSPTHSRRRGLTDPSGALRKKAEIRLTTKLNELSTPDMSNSVSLENLSNKSFPVTSSDYGTMSADTMSVMTQDDDTRSIASSGTSSIDQFVFLDMDSVNGESGNKNKSQSTIGTNKPKIPFGPREFSSPKVSQEMTDSQATVVEENNKSVNKMSITDEETILKSSKVKNPTVSLLKISAQNGFELCVDSHGNNASTRIVAHDILLKEEGNMTVDDLTNSFMQPASTSNQPLRSKVPRLRMRIDSGDCATRFYPKADGHMGLEVFDLSEKVLASTLANIGAFLEDDAAPEVLPMTISASNVTLTIEDDGDSVYPTTTKGPPITLKIHQANVQRDVAGVFHVTTQSSAKSSSQLLTSLASTISSSNQSEASPNTDSETQTYSTTTDSSQLAIETNSTSINDTIVCKSVLQSQTLVSNPDKVKNDQQPNDESKSGAANYDVANNDTPPLLQYDTISKQPEVNGDIKPDFDLLKKQLKDMTEERDSLFSTLRHMQEELMLSENEKLNLRMMLKQKQ